MKDGADGKRLGARPASRAYQNWHVDLQPDPRPHGIRDGIRTTRDRTMGELIDLDAYRRRKQGGLPRLATSREIETPKSPRSPDTYRLGLPKPPDRPDDPEAPEPA
jgi:hypothetical protein